MVKHLCDICGRELHDYQPPISSSFYPRDTKILAIYEAGNFDCRIEGELADKDATFENMEICRHCAESLVDWIKERKRGLL